MEVLYSYQSEHDIYGVMICRYVLDEGEIYLEERVLDCEFERTGDALDKSILNLILNEFEREVENEITLLKKKKEDIRNCLNRLKSL
jgi:hypothetical protein